MPKEQEPEFARRLREEFDLPVEAEAILQEAIDAFRRLEQIKAQLDAQDLVIEGRANSRVANPLIAAERAARSSFVQILRAINLPGNP